MESAVELDCILFKFFCFVTWCNQRESRRPRKLGSIEDHSKRFIVEGGLFRELRGAFPTEFYPVTSTNVRIIHQNLLNFSINPFATMV